MASLRGFAVNELPWQITAPFHNVSPLNTRLKCIITQSLYSLSGMMLPEYGAQWTQKPPSHAFCEACFMCRYSAHKWTVNIFWFRFVFASWLILLKCWLAETNDYTCTQVSWFVEPHGAPWLGSDVISSGWTPRGGRCHHSSVAYTRETWLSWYPVFLCSLRRLCMTLCLHKSSQWQRCGGGGGRGRAQIQAKKGPWLAICRALVSPSPLNTETLFGHPNVMSGSKTHGMVSPVQSK